MALLAHTKHTIDIIGRSIRIPLSETTASPDTSRDRSTTNPSTARSNSTLSRPQINCDFLLLNLNIALIDNAPDNKNNTNDKLSALANTSKSSVVHKLNTKIKPQETIAARSK